MNRTPPYKVSLRAQDLRGFELLNSLCAVEKYGELLSYLEAQLRRGWLLDKLFVVPPADVLIVLMTLAVIPHSGNSEREVKMDPCSVIKTSISTRSLKILTHYVDILHSFEPDVMLDHSVELLRCQFFIVLDHFKIPKSHALSEGYRDSQKRRKTNPSIRLEDTPYFGTIKAAIPGYSNPYGTYVSVLEHSPLVFKNIVLTTVLAHEGEFWNSVTWTLFCSISEDPHLFERSKKWVRLFCLLFDLFELQSVYFEELIVPGSHLLFDLFRSLSSSDTYSALCDILLLGFECFTAGDVNVHAVYGKEKYTPATFVPRTVTDQSSRFVESMAFRHRLLRSFTRLLDSRGAEMQSTCQVFSEARFVTTLSRHLSRIKNLEHLKQFFCVADLRSFFAIMPHIAQATLNEYLADLEQHRQISLVENLGGDDTMIDDLIELFVPGFPFLDEQTDQPLTTTYMLIEKCDICLLVVLRYWEHVHKSSRIRTRKGFPHLLDTIRLNDQRRIETTRIMNCDDITIPPLLPNFEKLFGL
ncbi:Smc5-Smc6 complex subunit NSE5 LALA0_S09e00144g [Lachancea lanzarotensis]|uniref:LALA0S09e00144g1_1 n=1 Tax=Lachancea lanzarotensis TaxID=1245769 RepID=A0A0C7N0K8_9SACH|nr:uncharacterized protein LALA0_S09e00144g [Lachancea lanzarotensis]CEP63682.1 LALA0S09e00144g1_1 [Lachancea lanzarotensis]